MTDRSSSLLANGAVFRIGSLNFSFAVCGEVKGAIRFLDWLLVLGDSCPLAPYPMICQSRFVTNAIWEAQALTNGISCKI